MPLSQPSGGGASSINRANFISESLYLSDGPDIAVNFTSSSYAFAQTRALIGGNNSFCGIIDVANIFAGKVAETAALPSTVIVGGDIADIERNNVDGGILVRIGNQFARSADDGATWVAITPGFGVTYEGIISWQNDQIMCAHRRIAAPDRDYTISTDNGATYPNQFFTGIDPADTARQKLRKNRNETILGVVGANATLALTNSIDLEAATWRAFDFQVLFPTIAGNGTDIAFNTDGSRMIYGTLQGDIVVSIDGGVTFTQFPEALNIFINGNTGASFRSVDTITYVAAIDSFILLGTDRGLLIDGAGNLLTGTTINYGFAAAATSGLVDAGGFSDGINCFAVGSANRVTMLVRGQ